MTAGTKPTFDAFHLAMLYDPERERLGIPLDTLSARELLRDEVALIAYYSMWVPDFRPVPKLKRLPRRRVRTAIGWLMFVVFLIVALLIVGVAIPAFIHSVSSPGTPGRVYVPSWVSGAFHTLTGS